MKKMLFVVMLVVVFLLSACSPTSVAECFELTSGKRVCFDGMVEVIDADVTDTDAVVEPDADMTDTDAVIEPVADVTDTDAVIEPDADVTDTDAKAESISEETTLDLGSIGEYHAVWDSKRVQWTLGIWAENTVRAGTGLSEFKLKATSVTFVMPADGTVNNSAGHISVNSVQWNLGNPAVSPTGETLVKEGDTVTIWTDGPNESAGFQIWFQN